jgi:acetyltransferase-like isoleucine patch superfamily enzyme
MLKKIAIKLSLILDQYKRFKKRSKFVKKYLVALPDTFQLADTITLKAFFLGQITLGNDVALGAYGSVININATGRIVIGKSFRMRSFCSIRNEGGVLEIGNHTIFNNQCSVNCFDSIKIGNHVMFGEGVKIYDHNHKYEFLDQNLYVHPNEFTTQQILIEDNCWIGSNVVILKGVTIGHNSIIGAGCVIFKSVPPNSIIVNKQDLEIKQIR